MNEHTVKKLTDLAQFAWEVAVEREAQVKGGRPRTAYSAATLNSQADEVLTLVRQEIADLEPAGRLSGPTRDSAAAALDDVVRLLGTFCGTVRESVGSVVVRGGAGGVSPNSAAWAYLERLNQTRRAFDAGVTRLKETLMANPFSSLEKDTVFVEKPDGKRLGPHRCVFDPGTGHVSIHVKELDVAEDDKVLRQLPGDRVESWTVVQVNYSHGLHMIPPHYTLEVVKDTATKKRPPTAPTFNITNSKNFQIGDGNTQLNVDVVIESLQALVQAIESSTATPEQKAEAKGWLKKLLENPAVLTVLGPVAEKVLGAFGGAG